MTNNDIIRRLRYTFNFNDEKMIALFALADHKVTAEQVASWLKKADNEESVDIPDIDLSLFLDGFIIDKRGKKEGVAPPALKQLNNNIILRKLKIALNLKDIDLQEVLQLADFRLSKHEISAFFRKPSQSQYRVCKNQILRNFLHGLQLKYRK